MPEAQKQLKKWACHKLECLGDYLEAHAGTLNNTRCCYLELFARGDSYVYKDTDCPTNGSELRALKIKTRFAKYIFVVRDRGQTQSLKRLTSPYNGGISIISGNPVHQRVLKQLFDLIPRSMASLALIDPPGYRRLRWSLIKNLATHGGDWQGHKTELLIIFPLEMALLRNLTRPECAPSITRLYGNSQWLEIKRKWQEGKLAPDEVRQRLVALFKAGLKSLGYRYVSDFSPTRFSRPPVYHIIWASDRNNRIKMIEEVWTKPRYLPGEMFRNE